jgi:hypothetical protein
MSAYSLTDRSDAALLRDLEALVVRDRRTTAQLVAHIAEVDARRLYAPAWASMHAYCVGRLRLSEDAAYKRIQAARAARRFPVLFEALAAGRLNLSSICLLAPHLSIERLDELVAAGAERSCEELRSWLAGRLEESRPAVAVVARQLEVRLPRLAAQQVAAPVRPATDAMAIALEPAPADPGPPGYVMQFTVSPRAHERLLYARDLMSHAVRSGDVAEIYRRAIELLIAQCEKRRFAATSRPGSKSSGVRGRHLPGRVRRAVWTRDGGRCTFVTPSAHRCGARRLLEFDHVVPAARGGLATVENLRLRCRAHNQQAADRVFGARFMKAKRREAHAPRDAVRSGAAPQRESASGSTGPPPGVR